MNNRPEFPFTAVVGQARYKLALQLALIDPAIGGVLVSGPRGTAKSTLARGLPGIAGDRTPFVNLPLGASEEMLTGTLDLQKALGEREVAFSPGLLAKAHGGVLYVDEVNLLPDNLVDLLLDAAASGINHVERDGISHQHDARFVLLGTMNPDEGELRPQLQDRFGMSVRMQDRYSAEERVEIVRQRESYDRDAAAFLERFSQQEAEQAGRLRRAMEMRDRVECANALRLEIAVRCEEAGVDGLRADIAWTRAAMAHAALAGRDRVERKDIDAVEDLVLEHRRHDGGSGQARSPAGSNGGRNERDDDGAGDWGQMPPARQPAAEKSPFRPTATTPPTNHSPRAAGDPYSRRRGNQGRGHKVARTTGDRLDWFRTLAVNLGEWPLRHLRFRRPRRGNPEIHLVLLDTSASTLRNNRSADAKAAVLRIAEQAYLDRAQLAILGFGNQQVEWLLTGRRAPRALRRLLDGIGAGGGTPLREVIDTARRYQRRLGQSQPALRFRNYLLTDGRSSASLDGLALEGDTILVDLEHAPVKRGRGPEFAAALGAQYIPLGA